MLVLVVTLIGAIAGAGYAVVTGHELRGDVAGGGPGLTQGRPPNQTSPANPQVNMSTEQAVAQSPPVIAQAAKIIGVPAGRAAGGRRPSG